MFGWGGPYVGDVIAEVVGVTLRGGLFRPAFKGTVGLISGSSSPGGCVVAGYDVSEARASETRVGVLSPELPPVGLTLFGLLAGIGMGFVAGSGLSVFGLALSLPPVAPCHSLLKFVFTPSPLIRDLGACCTLSGSAKSNGALCRSPLLSALVTGSCGLARLECVYKVLPCDDICWPATSFQLVRVESLG